MPLFIPSRRRAPRRPSMARSAESDPLAPPGGRRRRFLFSVIRFGAAMELGRWSYGVVVRNTPTAQHRNGSTSCSRSDISGWRDAALYPLAAPRAAPTEHSTVCKERPARAAWRPTSPISFQRNPVRGGDGARAMELRGRWRNTRPTAQHRNGSTSCSRSDISGWRDAALYPLAAPRAAPTEHSTVSKSDPLAPPGGRRRRFLLA